MSEASINAAVSGGAIGVAGAQVVQIENLYMGAAPSTEPAKPAGPIPPCPYPGLAYFGPEDASRFFGRERAIKALSAAVTKRSFTALVGASGTGKSSVVLAGLAPRLETRGGWRSTYFRIGTEPDKNPFAALARALSPLLGNDDIVDRMPRAQKLAKNLASGDISLVYVIGQCRAANPGKRILLIADQFEEVFTLVPDEALRNRFIDALIAAFPDPGQSVTPDVCLVLTLRADFYNAALRYRPLADRLQDHVENLGPMTRDELREAVVKPAEALHVEFEPGLVNTILDDVEKRPGSLPLLQFALREMWGRLKTPLMTRVDYDAIGGVEGALAKRAQAIFDGATQQGQDDTAVSLFRRLFTRMVTLGEGSEDTRRIVGREELGPDAWALAQELANEDNRLVVTAAPTPRQETAEVVHEALIRNWPALVDWVNSDRAFQSWLRQLKPRLDEWRTNPTDEGTLLRGSPLAAADDWIARRGADLNEEEKAFVAASVAQRDAEKWRAEDELRQEQARLRRARWVTAVVALIVVAVGGVVYWQFHANLVLDNYLTEEEGRIQQQLNYLTEDEGRLQSIFGAKVIELKRQHANLLGELSTAELARGNMDAALRFAAKGAEEDLALQLKPDPTSTSIAALAAAISEGLVWRFALRPGQEALLFEAFSHDGYGVVTASADGITGIGDVRLAAMSAWGLLDEVCSYRLLGLSTMSRDEMRLAGYPDSQPQIDVCAGGAR